MYFKLLSFLSIVKCRMYYVETEGGLHQKVESSRSSPARNGKEYIYSVGAENNNIDVEHADSHKTAENDNDYMDVEQKRLHKNNKHKKFLPKKKSHMEKTSLQTGQDYSDWVKKCSPKDRCSDESCMIQKDIPGCGGSIDLRCIDGCLNILKVRPLSFGHELQCQ